MREIRVLHTLCSSESRICGSKNMLKHGNIFQPSSNGKLQKGHRINKTHFMEWLVSQSSALENDANAIAEWVLGLNAQYARSGGAKMPLLLFFASVVSPELYDNASAKKLMLEKTKGVLIQAWPGPMLQWILGQIKDGEFLKHCQGRDKRDLRENLWEAEFYRSLMRFEQSKISDFRESMHKLTDIQQLEWQDEDVFLSRIWGEEYFLARCEASSDQKLTIDLPLLRSRAVSLNSTRQP